jgi:hypothetical protein
MVTRHTTATEGFVRAEPFDAPVLNIATPGKKTRSSSMVSEPQRPRQQPPGRVCARCPTILSRYNPNDLCSVCAMAEAAQTGEVEPGRCSPEHLESFLQFERQQPRRKRRRECMRGHPFTPENTLINTYADGRQCRQCRSCKMEATRRRREERWSHERIDQSA